MIVKEIADAVSKAEREGKKVAMLHYQVLINADELKGFDPVQFCREIGVQESYATEFRKMISLAELMKQQRVSLKKQLHS